ncbi:MAG: valine--tRNA ligase [Acholeplasmataceae bacterium]|jgi:valyl-tRNA synthetase|nr:valine--tRNA ligase [Acholeplasmataceae bacterium]
MAITTKYNHKKVEKNLYEYWLKHNLFASGDLTKKPFCTVIPPPNITGKLHLGHAMDNTLQDIIIRRKRMQGYDALYLPGTDHAGIATQAVVDQSLRERGLDRFEIGREAFLAEAWAWKEEYQSHIYHQWKSLGISVDYNHLKFTLDDDLNEAVNEVFLKLYEKGLIYRGHRIINWDVEANTALSNIEVDHHEVKAKLYYMKYPLLNSDEYLVVATTRPETCFADQAIMVHPDDKRYRHLIGETALIPLTDVKLKIIADSFVDIEFGTGAVKVTPAHDPNDFEVGLRHNLEMPLCMDSKGKMNEMAFQYEGLDRFECRTKFVADLKENNLLEKVEDYTHSVGHSERTGVVVEPRLSLQWFVKMKPLAEAALEKSTVKFFPARFEKIFTNWLEGIEDWCISRQLWWGHRIPVWYRGDEIKVQVESPGVGWVQDEDVLDTWFSSALWPFSTLGWPKKTELYERYYPTDVLVTGYDIIFFWVARMIFQGLEFTETIPFKEVLIHGLIRDNLGRKMSKSLGNGIDPMDIIEDYGVDALRYFLATNSTPGQDMRFEMEKVESTWNFINKLWNIARFVNLNIKDPQPLSAVDLNVFDRDLLFRINNLIEQANYHFERYDFGEAARYIYNFTWDYFASNYIEYAKLNLVKEETKASTEAVLCYTIKVILKLLHPFMPFVTEHLYQRLTNEKSIMIAKWPEKSSYHYSEAAADLDILNDLIRNVRNFRSEHNLGRKDLKIWLTTTNQTLVEQHQLLTHFLGSQGLKITEQRQEDNTFLLTGKDYNLYILKSDVISLADEIKELKESLQILEKELMRSDKMLSNKAFLEKANPEKVKLEKAKQKNYLKQYQTLKERLKHYETR